MTYRTKLFLLLFLAGFTGILSFLLIDLSALLSVLPAASETKLPFSPWLVKLISLIQPTVLLALAVFVGVALAPTMNLSASVFEALARSERLVPVLKPQIIPGLIGGLIGALAIILSYVVFRPFLPPEFAARAEAFNRLMPPLTRLLYGGITEEILLRWGLLTLLAWMGWKVFQAARREPSAVCFVSAILISSIIFGVGHLPVAVVLGGQLTVPIVVYIIAANCVFGLIAGYLYWRRGLESAIVAHMCAHVVLISALRFMS